MRRRPIISGQALTIIGLIAAVVYLSKKKEIVIQPRIDAGGISTDLESLAQTAMRVRDQWKAR